MAITVAARRPGPLRRGGLQALGDAQALGHGDARRLRDGLGADLRQPPGAEALRLQAGIEMRGDGQPEDGVSQEGQTAIGVRPALRPRRVREHLPVEVLRQVLEQLAQELHYDATPCAITKSTAWPTVRIFAASSSEMRTP